MFRTLLGALMAFDTLLVRRLTLEASTTPRRRYAEKARSAPGAEARWQPVLRRVVGGAWRRNTINASGKPQFMCFRALLYAVLHSIRIGFEGSKLKIVDQHASDGRVSHFGFPFLRWL